MKKLLILFIYLFACFTGCKNITTNAPVRSGDTASLKEMKKKLNYLGTTETEDSIIDRYTTSITNENVFKVKGLTEYSTLDSHFYKIYEFEYDKKDLNKGANVSIIEHPVGSCLKYDAKDYVPHNCGCYYIDNVLTCECYNVANMEINNGFIYTKPEHFSKIKMNEGHNSTKYFYYNDEVVARQVLNYSVNKDYIFFTFDLFRERLQNNDRLDDIYGFISSKDIDAKINTKINSNSFSWSMTKNGKLVVGAYGNTSRPMIYFQSRIDNTSSCRFFSTMYDWKILTIAFLDSNNNMKSYSSLEDFTADFNKIKAEFKDIALVALNDGYSIQTLYDSFGIVKDEENDIKAVKLN